MGDNGSDRRYLHKRRQGWYVSIEVPPSLRSVAGKKRVVRSLRTRDLQEARRRRWDVIREIKHEIAAAGRGNVSRSLVDEAMRWRDEVGNVRSNVDHDTDAEFGIGWMLGERTEEIERTHSLKVAKQFYALSSGEAEPVKQLSKTWLREIEGTVKEQTRSQHRTAINLLLGFHSEAATVEEISRKEAGRFISERLVPSGRVNKTINRIISSLSSFWKWMVSRGLAEENVWREQSLKKEARSTKRAFTEDELIALLSGKPGGPVAGVVLPDLMRLALFTGARSNELCSLRVADVKDGMLHLNSKTPAGDRYVPIHPAIAGIVKRLCKARTGEARLFPQLKPGGPDKKLNWYIGGRFREYRRLRGVPIGTPDKETDLHSFRRTFATALENAGILPNVAEELLGHEKQSFTFNRYSSGLTEEPLREAVERVMFSKAVMKLV